MRYFSLIPILLIFSLNPSERREQRFFDTLSAEQHLKSTGECRLCWLRRSELSHLDLRNAILEGADLSGTDLNRTNLEKANLRFVRMRRADLTTTLSLQGADLSFADLRESNIPTVVLESARLCQTLLPDGKVSRCD